MKVAVLAATKLGLSLGGLTSIYRIQFPEVEQGAVGIAVFLAGIDVDREPGRCDTLKYDSARGN